MSTTTTRQRISSRSPLRIITDNCQVCINESTCVLAFPEEAIIASHTYNGTDDITNFIQQDPDATAQASLENVSPYGPTWEVYWNSASTGDNYTVFISQTLNEAFQVMHGSSILPGSAYDIGAACATDSNCSLPDAHVLGQMSSTGPFMPKCLNDTCTLMGAANTQNCTLDSDCSCGNDTCYCLQNACMEEIQN